MAVLVWCRDGYVSDGGARQSRRQSVARQRRCGALPIAHELEPGSGRPGASALEGEIGTEHIPPEGENHYRRVRPGLYHQPDPVGTDMAKSMIDNDVREGSKEEALDALSDEELVIAHLHGRNGAFEDLYRRYRDRLVHFVTRKTGDGDQAQDLVQEAFIRVTRHLHRFDTSKKFSTWVYTIASNLSKNELRNRSRNPLVLFQRLTNTWDDDHRPIQFEDFRMRPDDLYRKRFLRRLVEDTVQELPEHHRLVFQLRELEGKSYEEISEITGVNLGTVKSRLHRARNSFAQRIEPFLN